MNDRKELVVLLATLVDVKDKHPSMYRVLKRKVLSLYPKYERPKENHQSH